MKRILFLLPVLSIFACKSDSVWVGDTSSSSTNSSTTTDAASTNNNLSSFVQLASVKYKYSYGVRSKLNQDGTLVLYLDNDSILKIMNTDGTGQITLSSTDTGSAVAGYDISGDGSTVIFTGWGNHSGTNMTTRQLYSVNADGTGVTVISPDQAAVGYYEPNITADGNKIAFLSYDNFLGLNSDYSSEIYTMTPDGSGLTQVTDLPGNTTIKDLVMSKDGSTFVFQTRSDLTGENSDGSDELFMTDATGSSITQITNHTSNLDSAADSHSLDISDDGKMLVFSSDADLIGSNPNGYQVGYQIDLNLMETRQFQGVGYNAIAVSGDGNWIFLASYPEGDWDITKVSSNISSATSYSLLPVLNDPGSDHGLYMLDIETDYDGTSFTLISDYDFIDGENEYLGDRLFYGSTY